MACKKAKGKRGKTRRKLKNKKGRVTVSGFLAKPKLDSRVLIDINSSVHSGMPAKRYQGKIGIVKSVKKNSVEVLVGKAGNRKTLVVHSCHLASAGGESK